MADRLFNRQASLTVDSIKIQTGRQGNVATTNVPSLRIAFKINKSLSKEPNNCEVSIWNLSREHRSDLAGKKKAVPVILEAGYETTIHQIFSGSMTFVQSIQDGNDWITKLQAGDGTDKIKSSRINVGLKGPVTMDAAIKAAAAALGVPLGNTAQKSASTPRATLTAFANGLVMSGKAHLEFDKIMKAAGLGWSIQDGALQLLGPTDTIGGTQLLLKPGTGLIGSPQAGDKGAIKVRSLLMPDLLPGKPVRIEAQQVSGNFRIDKAVFVGDTHGPDWYSDLELRPV